MGLMNGVVDGKPANFRPRIDMEYSEVRRKLARIQRALKVSRRLLESVAFVAKKGDTEYPLLEIERAEAYCEELRGGDLMRRRSEYWQIAADLHEWASSFVMRAEVMSEHESGFMTMDAPSRLPAGACQKYESSFFPFPVQSVAYR